MLAGGLYTVPARAKQAHVSKKKKKGGAGSYCNEVTSLNEAGSIGQLSNSAVFSLQVRTGGTLFLY